MPTSSHVSPPTLASVLLAVSAAVAAVVAGTHDHVGPAWAVLLGVLTGAGASALVLLLGRQGADKKNAPDE